MPHGFETTPGPGWVEFRCASGNGVLVVRVYRGANAASTRVCSWTETFRPSRVIEPASLRVCEIRQFLTEAFALWNHDEAQQQEKASVPTKDKSPQTEANEPQGVYDDCEHKSR